MADFDYYRGQALPDYIVNPQEAKGRFTFDWMNGPPARSVDPVPYFFQNYTSVAPTPGDKPQLWEEDTGPIPVYAGRIPMVHPYEMARPRVLSRAASRPQGKVPGAIYNERHGYLGMIPPPTSQFPLGYR